NFTLVFDDDNDSLFIVDLYLDNQPVTETSTRDIAETSARIKRLNRLLIHWIICDQQAFQVVENEDFRKLILVLDPRVKVAMTVDTWFACTNQAYLSITLHWIDNNWCIQYILLNLVPLHERHTEIFIAENIIEQVEYFRLGKQLLSLTMDNAANMDAYGYYLATLLESRYNNTNFCRIRCASHILNLTVKEEISVLDKSVKKAREFTSHIHRSQPSFEELKRSIMKLLEPIYEATKLLSSSSHPTLGDLRTVFYVIIEVLDDSQIEEDTIKGQVAKKISRKIDYYWYELQTYFYEAVFLDPSTKFTTFEHTTSVTSEQIFSIAKHTISETRNCIDAEKARASLCLKTWYEAGMINNWSSGGNQFS
ncbi:10335_t:CDS:2, partial [Cetraspora pellucida]